MQTLGCQITEFIMGARCVAYRILARNPLGKKSLRRFRIWKNDIQMDLIERGYEVVKWIQMAHDHIQCLASVLLVLNLQILLPEGCSGNKLILLN